jgi:predicted nucleic acid-binding Zn ribbon protein
MATDAISLKQYPEWVRGPAHIDGDEVVLNEEAAEKYLVDESEHREQLLHDLTALSEYDPQGVVNFVRRHGLLWHGPEHLGGGECRESLTYWQAAAWDLRILIGLYIRLQDAESMRKYLRSLRDGKIFWTPIPDDNQLCLEYASIELARGITQGLEGCSWTLTAGCTLKRDGVKVGGPTDFLFGDDPPNLEAAAYAQLASRIVNKAPFNECEGCGTLFTPEHGSQRYCSQRCGNRARKARQRAREAKQA